MKFKSFKMTHVDGRMHHIGTRKEHVAENVIITPDPLMIPFYAKFLDNAQLMGDYREYVTYTGTYRGKPLSIMSCGFGCMPVAIAVEELHHLDVKQIIRIGENPAIQKHIAVGEICLASGSVRSEGNSKEYIDISYPAIADMDLLFKLMERQKDLRISIFRSHDVENLDSPYGPDGMERIRKWSRLGVDVFDGETSSMYITASCIRNKTASLSLVHENYLTGKKLDEETLNKKREEMFRIAADVLTA
ncbi:MAG TPA: hypothetical protein PLI19_03200 [Erysipelotrichaceae bacterium]|nr:hypothetical protein [Erysipelotrichaceae bacterium]